LKKDIKELQPGELLLISTGEYSDYSFSGPFRVMKQIRFNRNLLDELRKDWVPDFEGQKFSPHQICGSLNALGYIEDEPAFELHVGSYGRVDEDAFPEENLTK
jgi:hypothetical protein